MSTETFRELSDRVALAKGWRPEDHHWRDAHNCIHFNPTDPMELLWLMTEFNVYPYLGDEYAMANGCPSVLIADCASKQEAYVRCALLGILTRLEERGEG